MIRRLALMAAMAGLLATLLAPTAGAATGPYRWRIASNTCEYMTTLSVEFTVLGASRANKVILTGQVQQLIDGKWHKGRINGRSVETFTANGQPHVFSRETAESTDYGYSTTLRLTMKLQAFKGRTLLWQKVAKGISCTTT